MRAGLIIVAGLTLAGLAGLGASAQPAATRVARATTPAEPVVVELFTAQGCAGCPDANRALEAAAQAPGVIALTYGVDYWDYLGWPDTFAKPEFTARQRAYREALKLRAVATPQVVVDGRLQLSGARPDELEAVIDREAARRVWPPEMEFREDGRSIGVGAGRPPRGGAEVLAVTYRPGVQVVEVGGGDNRGRRVPHVNVVTGVRRLGDWTGRPALFALPRGRGEGEAVAVLVQAKRDRSILAAAAS
jgi:hypothetical protein